MLLHYSQKSRTNIYGHGVALLALMSVTGCASAGSTAGFWGSMNPYNWFGSKPVTATPPIAQKPLPNAIPANASPLGANSRLGAGPQKNNTWLSSMTAPLTKPFANPDKPLAPGDEALSLDSHPKNVNPQLFVQMARVYETKGDYAGALKQYEQALKVAPQNVEVLLGMARAFDRKGDYPQAISTYEQAAKLDPKNGVICNDLGLCYARHEDLARAQENLAKAVAIAPTSQLYRNNLATVLVQQGRYDDALQQLLTVLPEPAAHYNLGYLAERFGNRPVALQHFQQAAALDPNLLAARQMITKLQATAAQVPTMEQVSTRVNEASLQAQQAANNNIQATEMKIRNAIQAQTSSLAPRYASPLTAPNDTNQSDYGTPTNPPSQSAPPGSSNLKPLPPLDQ